jgi:hypothetical protein
MTQILAVVARDKNDVGGGAPQFFAATEEEFYNISFNLEKILDASAHLISPSVMILVKHG